jgi:hypothetical protein
MADAIRRAVGMQTLRVRQFPWALLSVIAPCDETVREVLQVESLWHEPI